MKLNLRNKFLFPTLILVIIGMGFSTLFSITYSKTALENTIETQMSGMSGAITAHMDSWLKRIAQDLEIWNEMDAYQAEIGLYNAQRIMQAPVFNAAQLTQSREKSQYYEYIVLVAENGDELLWSNYDGKEKNNIADKNFFSRSIKGEIVITDIFKSQKTSRPVFIVSAPVYGIDPFGTETTDTVAGVIYGVIDLDFFPKPISTQLMWAKQVMLLYITIKAL